MITVSGDDRTTRLSEDELRAIYGPEYVSQYDPHALVRMRRLLPFLELSSDQTVADFGCGNGVLLELIGGRIREYVGIDFSQAFIRAAEQRRNARGLLNGTFQCSEIVPFCTQHPNRFDAGFALDFSEHVYDDQFLSMFHAIQTALRPGARLYLHTPNADYFMERFRARGVLSQIEGHVAVRDARRHEVLLAQCGFVDIHVHYLAHYLSLASAFHGLGALPLVGRYFRARLFVTGRKPR